MRNDSRFSDLIKLGVTVRTLDDEKVGRVVEVGSDTFIVEKGIFFPKDYLFRFDEIVGRIHDDELQINLTKAQLENRLESGVTSDLNADTSATSMRSGAVATETMASGLGTSTMASGLGTSTGLSATSRLTNETDEVRTIPVIEEELEVHKHVRQGGEVRIHKEVIAEEKHVAVPVVREEVKVERIAVNRDASDIALDANAFREETIAVPLMKEEVEVSKRPVVKEEVRVSKHAIEETAETETTLRKERIEIETDSDVKRVS